MIELARKQLPQSTLFAHDLGAPLNLIAAHTLDGIICALALEYVQDLHACLAEFHRMLCPRGFLVFSIENPLLVYRRLGRNYWQQELVEHPPTLGEAVQGYRRPLSMYLNTLRDAGFVLEHFVEAKPVDRCEALYPEVYQKMLDAPYFMAIRALRHL
jgi:ubiquinone/menaquinone biosynthesis C-methylase UbiE